MSGLAIGITVIVLIVALIVVDVFLVIDQVKGNTWSEMLRDAARCTTFPPWVFGVLSGRWFHPVDDWEPLLGNWSFAVLMAVTWLVVVVGDILRRRSVPVPGWLVILIAVPVGAVFAPITFA